MFKWIKRIFCNHYDSYTIIKSTTSIDVKSDWHCFYKHNTYRCNNCGHIFTINTLEKIEHDYKYENTDIDCRFCKYSITNNKGLTYCYINKTIMNYFNIDLIANKCKSYKYYKD